MLTFCNHFIPKKSFIFIFSPFPWTFGKVGLGTLIYFRLCMRKIQATGRFIQIKRSRLMNLFLKDEMSVK